MNNPVESDKANFIDSSQAPESATSNSAVEFSVEEKELLAQVPSDGNFIGNTTLRRTLGWQETDYWNVRDGLLGKNVLVLGRGRGGSVARVKPTEPESAIPVATESSAASLIPKAEAEYYQDALEVLRDRWCKELAFKEYFVEITAKQGRRTTGGLWTRPDLTVIHVSAFDHVPGRFMDVITFELKTAENLDLTAVYEALAHLRAAHRAYILVEFSGEVQLPNEVLQEAEKQGVGFIRAKKLKDFATWETILDPRPRTPEPSEIDNFIRTQISDENKAVLRRWLR
jgi:hypothetical protein